MKNMHKEQRRIEEERSLKAEKKEERENRVRRREKLFQLLQKREDGECHAVAADRLNH